MHAICICVLLLLACTIGAQTTPPQGIRNKTPESGAFTNARIVVAPARIIDRGTVIVDDGRITAVGAEIPVPEGALEIDLDGKWL